MYQQAIVRIFRLLPLTRAEFSQLVEIHPAKLDAWLSDRFGYKEPDAAVFHRARAVLRRHVKTATDVLNGVSSQIDLPQESAPVSRLPVTTAEEVALVASLLPMSRGELAEKLGVSRRRLDGWCSGEKRRPPELAVSRKIRELFAAHVEAVKAAQLPILGAPWER